jgi:hypothetical protein
MYVSRLEYHMSVVQFALHVIRPGKGILIIFNQESAKVLELRIWLKPFGYGGKVFCDSNLESHLRA